MRGGTVVDDAGIRVSKQELLDRVTANRDQHREVYERALENYRRKVVEELEAALDETRRKVDEWLDRVEGGEVLDIRMWVAPKAHLPVPEEHTRDYDRIITMIQMSTDDDLILDETDFRIYVMDDWEWAQSFAANTVSYTT